jgi:hypothetical protein
MNQATVHHIEHLVSHHLAEDLAESRIVFHAKVTITHVRDDHLLGDILFHDMPIEGGTYYPHTNINKVVYENCADLRYVPARSEEEKSSDSRALKISTQATRELSIEAEDFGEWEFECFLNQVNKEECGQFLFEAYGSKDKIAYPAYPKKLHFFMEDSFDTYVLFERLLDKAMQKYGFL